jgi:hypothetical protein
VSRDWAFGGFQAYDVYGWNMNAAGAGGANDLSVGHIGEAVIGGSLF